MKLLRRKIKLVDPKKLQFIGDQYLDKPSIQLFVYDKTEYQEIQESVDLDLIEFSNKDKVYWLNIHGIHDVQIIEGICEKQHIHRLVVKDIVDTSQRPKLQEFEDYLFFSIKSILPENGESLEIEQISFILGRNYVISFQEKKGDHFEHIRQRIRENKGISRERGPDFLLFLLLESIIDNYAETVETFEHSVSKAFAHFESVDPGPATIKKIEEYKEELFQIKKSITPLKDAISLLETGVADFIKEIQKSYYFDLKDHCLRLIDELGSLDQKLESIINLFFSYQGHRMNQVMKTLTVVATIFIPLTFIAGIYGMNFEYMPELSWKWGYFGIWGIILLLLLSMIIYFKRNKWF